MSRKAQERLQLALCLVTILRAVTVTASATKSSIWTRSSKEGTVHMTRMISASSVIQCGAACLRRPDCRGFCFDPSFKVCYVEDPDSSQLPSGDLKCFRGNGTETAAPTCPVERGYTLYMGYCLKWVDKYLTYRDARGDCRLTSGHLVMMKIYRDRDFILEALANSGVKSPGSFWLGADMLDSSSILWADGTVVQDNLRLWATDHYLTSDGNHSCVYIKEHSGSLYTGNCSHLKKYVCQITM